MIYRSGNVTSDLYKKILSSGEVSESSGSCKIIITSDKETKLIIYLNENGEEQGYSIEKLSRLIECVSYISPSFTRRIEFSYHNYDEGYLSKVKINGDHIIEYPEERKAVIEHNFSKKQNMGNISVVSESIGSILEKLCREGVIVRLARGENYSTSGGSKSVLVPVEKSFGRVLKKLFGKVSTGEEVYKRTLYDSYHIR